MFEDGYFFNLSNFDDDFEQASMIDGVVGSIPNLKFEALAAWAPSFYIESNFQHQGPTFGSPFPGKA